MQNILDEANKIVANRIEEKTQRIAVPGHLSVYTASYVHPVDMSKFASDDPPEMPEVEEFTVYIDENGEFPPVHMPDGTVVILERRPTNR